MSACESVVLSVHLDSPLDLGLPSSPARVACSKPPGHLGAHVHLHPNGSHVEWEPGAVVAMGWAAGQCRGHGRQRVLLVTRTPDRAEVEVAMLTAQGGGGEMCGACGSLLTVRIGKCVRCMSCGADGECG